MIASTGSTVAVVILYSVVIGWVSVASLFLIVQLNAIQRRLTRMSEQSQELQEAVDAQSATLTELASDVARLVEAIESDEDVDLQPFIDAVKANTAVAAAASESADTTVPDTDDPTPAV